MRIKFFLVIVASLMAYPVLSQENPDLEELYNQDQAARQSQDINWEELNIEDAKRRDTVLSILQAGGVRTAKDFFNAAMIFQHGSSTEEIRLAHSFATIAASLDSSLPNANWMKAASWDRLLLNFEQPQWYGTQFVRDESGNLTLYKMQPEVITDEQRVAWSVPTLEESRARIEQINSRE